MRYFKLVTHLTIPRSIKPGMGNTHHRPTPGDVIAIDDEACARESRFINGRLRANDMKETNEAEWLAFVKATEAKAAIAVEPTETAQAAPAAKGK